MSSKILLVLCISLLTCDCAKRDKRTIGILFRGLVEAVTGNGPVASLAYPQDGGDKTTPRPDSRPQTQIFFVPLPEKQVEFKPPAPLKPADLAEIHIHPRLVKQLESLARAQAIKGKMITKRLPLNLTDEVTQDSNKNENVKKPDPPLKAIPKNKPMKYMVKILPENDQQEGAISVTIAVGNDGKIRIVPGSEKINLNVEMLQKSKETSHENKNSSHPEIPPDSLPIHIIPLYPQGPYYNLPPPTPLTHPHYTEVYPPYPHAFVPPSPSPSPYSEVNPYSDFLNLLGLGDEPPQPNHPPNYLVNSYHPSHTNHNSAGNNATQIKYTHHENLQHHSELPFNSSHGSSFPHSPSSFPSAVHPYAPGFLSNSVSYPNNQVQQPFPGPNSYHSPPFPSHQFVNSDNSVGPTTGHIPPPGANFQQNVLQSPLNGFQSSFIGYPSQANGFPSQVSSYAAQSSGYPSPVYNNFPSPGSGFPSQVGFPSRPFHGPSHFHSNHFSLPSDPFKFASYPLRRLKNKREIMNMLDFFMA